MKRIGAISTAAAAVFLLLGLAAPVYAYQDQQQKPPKQEQQAKPAKQQQAKPARAEQTKSARQEQPKPAREQQAKAKPARTEQTKSARQEQPKQAKEQQAKAKPARTEQTKSARQEQPKQAKEQQERGQRAESSQRPQRTQQAEARQRSEPALRLSARGDSRIPDARFHSNFGRGHEFHMGNPVLVGGYSRFQYGGYWFGFVQPWPAAWYYTDDVYIDYVDGGYYMYDPYYPGQRIAISVYL
ncbi:MAG: hypothetical protein WBE86_08570 [Candidatus Acidiferrales bacterium]